MKIKREVKVYIGVYPAVMEPSGFRFIVFSSRRQARDCSLFPCLALIERLMDFEDGEGL